jgi:hypothetical protein
VTRASIIPAVAAVMAVVLTGSAIAAPVQLEERTSLRVRLLQTLVSGGQKKGEEVRFEVVEDVLGPRREVLIGRGTQAYGTITRSSGRGMFGKPGSLEFTVEKTRAVDGTSVFLRATETGRGRNNAAAAIATGVLLAPIALFVHGRDVKFDAGKEFTVFVDRDVTIDPDNAGGTSGTTTAATPAGRLYVLTLKNADKITGSIDGLTAGFYSVGTSAGSLKIAQADVVSMIEKQTSLTATVPAPALPAAQATAPRTSAPSPVPTAAPAPPAPAVPIGKMAYVLLKTGGKLSGVVDSFQDGVYKLDCANGRVIVSVSDIDRITDHY